MEWMHQETSKKNISDFGRTGGLIIDCRSPSAYQDLRNSGIILLPAKSTLIEYKNSVKQKPGIQNKNMEWMHQEASKKNISDFGRTGGLIIDEMTIQEDLQIQRKDDAWEVIGAENMGNTNNAINTIVSGKRQIKLATTIVQIMFHGKTGFRWPVVFHSSTTANSHQLYNIIWESISALGEKDFKIDYIMFDGAAANRSLTHLMCDNPKMSEYTIIDVFDNNHTINIIQDIKHVLKKIRNNLEASRSSNANSNKRHLILNSYPVLWEHFENAFIFNYQSGLRIHKRLTKEHIFLTGPTKMRNKLATDTFNKDMLYLMQAYKSSLEEKQGEALNSTIDLLSQTSEMVDIFMDSRPIISQCDQRLNKLQTILTFFHAWENDPRLNKCNLITRETREDIDAALMGFLSLCKRCVSEGHSLTPAYMNSDLVENHFCQQRGICNGLNTNPTVQQYGPRNNAIILGQTTLSGKCNTGGKATFYEAVKHKKSKKSRSTSKSALRRL
ncbi:hypothetical protein FSP39_015651 [Pinctada imbricata]|uniref:Uncharacterized protein n=1 Tax=Pinctada imbricata TaxID=66713 RepID=A0AA88XIE1_PINIB|nr:hypothetical protein FSP39_015651 [Pinctada imbricata]